jgi:hypothetical protein
MSFDFADLFAGIGGFRTVLGNVLGLLTHEGGTPDIKKIEFVDSA